MKLTTTILILSLIASGVSASPADAAIPDKVQPLLVKFCSDCHGAETREADVRLDTLSSLEKAPLLES